MKVQNSTGVDMYVSAIQAVVADGETIDVDDIVGVALTEQGWKAAKAGKRTPTPTADTADTETKE